MIAIALLALVLFAFFFLSLRVKNNITFTDDLPTMTTPVVTIADPTLGQSDAKVTVVEFGDYACGSCKTVNDALLELAQLYPKDVRLVWKDMPNQSVHPEALNAALAARCAAKQNKDSYFTYQAYLFANQDSLGVDLYPALATQLKLNPTTLSTCVTKQETLPLVQRTYEEGLALNISATPTVFINGTRFTGTLAKADLSAAIKAALH